VQIAKTINLMLFSFLFPLNVKNSCNKTTTQNDAPVVYGDSIDLLMNSMTYEPMFMLAILPVAAMGAIASVIDDDAARWINGASKDTISENEWSYCT
jgi:hypothetical protein